MQSAVTQVEPVTQLQRNYQVVLDQLENGPVVLSKSGRAAAVVLSVTDYDRQVQRLRRLEAIVEAHKLEAAANEAGTWIPWETTKARMATHAAVAD